MKVLNYLESNKNKFTNKRILSAIHFYFWCVVNIRLQLLKTLVNILKTLGYFFSHLKEVQFRECQEL